MGKKKTPNTQALRALNSMKADFSVHPYKYEDKGGTAVAARELGVEEHRVVKTLVFETDAGEPLIYLMNGDLEVSTKKLARILGVKSVSPSDPGRAEKITGCLVGGISPFGLRREVSVYAQKEIFELDRVMINAGRRGLLVDIAVSDLGRILDPVAVEAAV